MKKETLEKIQQEQRRYAKALEQIRADKNLSDLGKKSEIQLEHSYAQGRIQKLRTDDAAEAQARGRELRGRVFGPGRATMTEFRDAQDRVAKVNTPEELGRIMEAAQTNGDASMVRAAAGLAYDRSQNKLSGDRWRSLVDEYADASSHREQIAELDALSSTASGWEEAMLASVSTPAELRGTAL